MRKKEEEERELELKKEREKLIEKRKKILTGIIYKIDRKITIILKNDLEKWNLRAKLIGLKEIHEKDINKNKERGKTRDKSKKPRKRKKFNNNNNE